MKNLLHSKDLSKREILSLLDRAEEFLETVHKRKRLKLADGKILAALFYEPSTRTRFSFETAMLRLGGEVISNEGMNETSSAKKGETLYDTGRVVSQMADIIAMRHPEPGSALELVEGARVPVVNAGDGYNEHPTQSLLDVYTIFSETLRKAVTTGECRKAVHEFFGCRGEFISGTFCNSWDSGTYFFHLAPTPEMAKSSII